MTGRATPYRVWVPWLIVAGTCAVVAAINTSHWHVYATVAGAWTTGYLTGRKPSRRG